MYMYMQHIFTCLPSRPLVPIQFHVSIHMTRVLIHSTWRTPHPVQLLFHQQLILAKLPFSK